MNHRLKAILEPLSRNQKLWLLLFWGLAVAIDLFEKMLDLDFFSRPIYYIFEGKVALLFLLILINPKFTRLIFILIFAYLLLRCTFFPSTMSGTPHQMYFRVPLKLISSHIGFIQLIHLIIYSLFIYLLVKNPPNQSRVNSLKIS